MATSTAKVATAAMNVATITTSIPMTVGPDAGGSAILKPSLDLEVDHLGHDEHADAHPHQPAGAGDHQPLVDEEALHVLAVDEPDEDEDDEGQRADDPGRGLGFR